MLTISAPHKMLFSGSYVVLDGAPSLTLAIGPRLFLSLNPQKSESWPKDNPFINAVRHILLQQATKSEEVQLFELFQAQLTTRTTASVQRWGIGSSAAFTTALTFALLEGIGRSPSLEELFPLARQAHRLAQGHRGSGTDIAAVTFGDLLLVSQAQGDALPLYSQLSWNDEIAIILLQTGQKADTRQLIQRYQSLELQKRTSSSRPLISSIEKLTQSLEQNEAILPALQHNHEEEVIWSQKLNIPLVTDLHLQLIQQFRQRYTHEQIVLKALGAGGGDSIGLFFNPQKLPLDELTSFLKKLPFPFRLINIEKRGTLRLQ